MTFGLKKFQSVETNMRQLIPPLVRSTEELLNLMDASYQETVSKIIRQEAQYVIRCHAGVDGNQCFRASS